MKRLAFAILTVSLIISSCSKDPITKSNTYDFKAQNLQGMIGGNAWTFVAGNVSESWDEDFSFRLYAAELEDDCSGLWDGDYILFSCPMEVGVYELNWDWNDPDNMFTVTLLEDDDIPMNNIASEGAVEILSINLETGVLKGRMDVRSDGETYANGNFTLSICE